MSGGSATELAWRTLPAVGGESGRLAVLSLNRPDAANSFNDVVIREMIDHLVAVARAKDCRALVVRGKGKHFSAGADLAWMKASAQLGYEDNIKDARNLIGLFEALCHLPVPTLAVVTGSAFGGAVGLTACCDVALASEGARFCLSEIKLGLMPAVILPYLARKLQPGQLRRLALTGRLFSATEAETFGLVQRVASDDRLEQAVREELNGFLAGSPEAQSALKELLHKVQSESLRQGPHTAEGIAGLRVSASGQAGLQSFFDKRPAPWTKTLPPEWSLDGQG